MKTRKSDIRTTNLGTIISIRPVTAKGRQWLYANVPDSRRTMSRAVDCEARCGVDILEAMLDAGLTLEDAQSGRQAVR